LNSKTHIEVRRISSEEWGCLYETSLQASPFSHPDYIAGTQSSPEYWGVFYKKQIACGVVFMTQSDQPLQVGLWFTVYQSLLMARWLDESPPHTRGILIPRLIESLLQSVTAQYAKLHFSIHPSWRDMRPFQWLNYHKPEDGLASIKLHYTASLSLDGDITSGLNDSRRGDLKRAQKAGLTFSIGDDLASFVPLYIKTFSKHGHETSEETQRSVARTAEVAIRHNLGWLHFCRSRENLVIGAVLILFDKETAYYLIAGNDPEYRNTGAGTALLLESILEAKRRGLKYFDFIGVNSPQRGEFKLGFGGELKPYFSTLWTSLR